MKKVYIVAEIGCNHNGNYGLAKKMVKEAAEAGVDAVKFQTFKAESLISKVAPKADYQKKTTGNSESQLQMTKKLELPREDYVKLKKYAEELDLDVFSTAFDFGSVEFLESLGQSIWKIPSGEITNLPYLEKIGRINVQNKKIILSTGMATLKEIEEAISVLQKEVKNKIVILHCNTEYPTKDEDINVSAIMNIKEKFPQYEVGFSDHSVGSLAATMSVALGSVLIEKHFTLDKNLPGPDHKASATPAELKALVLNVHKAEVIRGNGIKHVTKSERKNKIVARKSIVALTDIKKGDVFSQQNITCKRPGNGISPMDWYKLLGTKAEKDFSEDELIKQTSFYWQE